MVSNTHVHRHHLCRRRFYLFFSLLFPSTLGHICHWVNESPPASRSELKLLHVLQWAAHTWSSCPSMSVPLAEKSFLSPGLTATTGLSGPQHMGPHMLTFTTAATMKLTLLQSSHRTMTFFPLHRIHLEGLKILLFLLLWQFMSSLLLFLL